jgi:ABC-2 type transport system ATP-binding protein
MTAAIRTHGLCRDYGPVRAVADLDLVVEPGQVFAFLGPNGAGKTTTIRMLLALQRQTSGRAEVLGLDCGRDYAEIHQRTGYLPGELALYPRMTGRQHIAWYAGARGLRDLSLAGALAERFGAVLDRPARELSKGNRQKVGLILPPPRHPLTAEWRTSCPYHHASRTPPPGCWGPAGWCEPRSGCTGHGWGSCSGPGS